MKDVLELAKLAARANFKDETTVRNVIKACFKNSE